MRLTSFNVGHVKQSLSSSNCFAPDHWGPSPQSTETDFLWCPRNKSLRWWNRPLAFGCYWRSKRWRMRTGMKISSLPSSSLAATCRPSSWGQDWREPNRISRTRGQSCPLRPRAVWRPSPRCRSWGWVLGGGVHPWWVGQAVFEVVGCSPRPRGGCPPCWSCSSGGECGDATLKIRRWPENQKMLYRVR